MTSPRLIVKLGCAVCGLSLMAGVAACLMQSPAAQAVRLADAGEGYYKQAYADGLPGASSSYLLDMSARTLAQAVSKDPRNPEYWSRLTAVLRAKGAERQADLALAMAQKLSPVSTGNNTSDAPVDVALLSRLGVREGR
jgi:cytochrome c-type biogenesis protein CcmH/NrfG